MPFSETTYWGDVDGGTFVYNSNSLLYPHVENYKAYMKNMGVDVKEASLISYNQIMEMMTLMQTEGIYLNLKFTSFWTGTANSNDNVYSISSNGNSQTDRYAYHLSSHNGVRPIIVIPVSDIEVS